MLHLKLYIILSNLNFFFLKVALLGQFNAQNTKKTKKKFLDYDKYQKSYKIYKKSKF